VIAGKNVLMHVDACIFIYQSAMDAQNINRNTFCLAGCVWLDGCLFGWLG